MENLAGAITLETLPRAFTQLLNEVAEIKGLIRNIQQVPEADQWFDLEGLCSYLPDRPSKHTVYEWVHNAKVPVHKGGKKLRFLKSEIDQWLKEGRRKTLAEIASEADQHCKTKRR
jgi:excisionase family DNA binding protein